MKNIKRSADYIAHKHLINGCESYNQLCNMEFIVHDFAAKGTDEGRDLILELINKKSKLNNKVK